MGAQRCDPPRTRQAGVNPQKVKQLLRVLADVPPVVGGVEGQGHSQGRGLPALKAQPRGVAALGSASSPCVRLGDGDPGGLNRQAIVSPFSVRNSALVGIDIPRTPLGSSRLGLDLVQYPALQRLQQSVHVQSCANHAAPANTCARWALASWDSPAAPPAVSLVCTECGTLVPSPKSPSTVSTVPGPVTPTSADVPAASVTGRSGARRSTRGCIDATTASPREPLRGAATAETSGGHREKLDGPFVWYRRAPIAAGNPVTGRSATRPCATVGTRMLRLRDCVRWLGQRARRRHHRSNVRSA